MTRFLMENAAWKLCAFIISAALWYAFVGETEVAASVPVAVQFKNDLLLVDFHHAGIIEIITHKIAFAVDHRGGVWRAVNDPV